ncbi:MAG: hypothetical protein AAFR88_13940, partial [Pseudomonadota bacterium]
QEAKGGEEDTTAAAAAAAAREDDEAAPHTPPVPPPPEEEARSKKTTPPKRPQDLLARFIVLILGPRIDDEAPTSVSAQLCERRHAEMGAAAAALMQDDAVVRAMYESSSPAALLEAIDLKLSSMRILPRTSRPTKKAVKTRASRMYQQLAQLKRVAEEQALARAKEVNNQREN